MPFGGEAGRDLVRPRFCFNSVKRWSPMPFGGEAGRDYDITDEPSRRQKGSPMPFGGEAGRDLAHPKRFPYAPPVTNAFRRGGWEGFAFWCMMYCRNPSTVTNAFRRGGWEGYAKSLRDLVAAASRSPMPFGGEAGRDYEDTSDDI